MVETRSALFLFVPPVSLPLFLPLSARRLCALPGDGLGVLCAPLRDRVGRVQDRRSLPPALHGRLDISPPLVVCNVVLGVAQEQALSNEEVRVDVARLLLVVVALLSLLDFVIDLLLDCVSCAGICACVGGGGRMRSVYWVVSEAWGIAAPAPGP